MKSYTKLRNLYGTLTKNTVAANLTLGDELINDDYRTIVSLKDFAFLHRARTLSTVASTQFIPLPYDVELVESVSVTVGSTKYTPKLLHSREEWDILNQTTSTSDTPQYALVYNQQIGLWPTPASSGSTITINGKIRVIDLSIADYTTGTILTLAASGTTVTGGSTVWTAPMAGRFMRITYSDTANTGDGHWYEISSVASNTSLVLSRAYGGTAIATGTAAYTIGQMPLLPEFCHDAPVYGAAATYWDKEGDEKRAASYRKTRDAKVATLVSQYSAFVTDPVLEEGMNGGIHNIINPNLTITL